MSDDTWGGGYATWNVSRTEGPLGPTCNTSLHDGYSNPCYTSCGGGDCSYLADSCDWTSCHDDLAYTQAVLTQLLSTYCVDTQQIHMSGKSNGGNYQPILTPDCSTSRSRTVPRSSYASNLMP